MAGGGSNQIGPTSDQNAQQAVNAQLWNYYQQNYAPYIQKYSQNTQSSEAQKENQVTGQVNAEVMKNLPRPNTNTVANTNQMDKATQIASGAEVDAQGKAKQRYLGNLENLVAIGRGQATTAQAGLDTIASQSIQKEIGLNELNQQESSSMASALGSGVGAAAAMSSRPQVKTLSAV